MKIEYKELYVPGYVEEEDERFPVEEILKMEDPAKQHIHGYLSISIGEKKLPNLGYFGEDDVCFNTWIAELDSIIRCFSKSTKCCYVFDEGEQGQPAFEFRRDNGLVYVSIVDSKYFGGHFNPDWQNVSCFYTDFDVSIRTFLHNIEKDLSVSLKDLFLSWWQNTLGYACGVCSHS